MASELTLCGTGHRVRVRPRAARKTALHASPMTAAQRQALHELIHSPPTTRSSPWARPARVADMAWVSVLALLFAVCVVSALEDLGYLPAKESATAMAATRPHVDERVAYAPGPGAGVIR